MNCTRVLHILNPRPLSGPIMPVDMAMRFCLSHSPPVRSFLSSYEDCHSLSNAPHATLRPCINTRGGAAAASDPSGSPRQSRGSPTTRPRTMPKKRVVFADSKGMSLTAIHIFKEFEEDPLAELQFDLADLEKATAGLKISMERSLVLDFAQPAADYLDFRSRLKKNQVCLENCTVQDRTLTGTVKVCNVSFEKSVSVRITQDSWATFQDVECSYMNNVYGGPDTDTFAFSAELPAAPAAQQCVEFCVRYHTPEQTYWDNNDGNNYRLVASDGDGEQASGGLCSGLASSAAIPTPSSQEFKRDIKQPEMEFDQFGSPRTSSGFFPEWQSWGRIENTTIYW
ncbi:protein phosphatase 1 regulatory subunit 3C-B [Hypomesus transpacificus]|uniref:protein phosphatase 1 regulatory subunit 3C-B n=1 Tax=Hypomesus transpacificus TaxID=137520 RepID=UPI001F07D886|nr:protein phosphatase 1 regulatory subunit 3C-B [Hypomesus transpacificus]